jgi:hypothetical protein
VTQPHALRVEKGGPLVRADEFETPSTRPTSDNVEPTRHHAMTGTAAEQRGLSADDMPTGRYVGQMLDPGGWPEVDQGTFVDRAQEYTRVLRQVTEVLKTCQQQQGEIFDGGIWSGGAADAANATLMTNIGELVALQDEFTAVITWHEYVAGLIVQAKSTINTNVRVAQKHIKELENDPRLDDDVRNTVIDTLVSATHRVNVIVVADTAEQILATLRPPEPGAPPPADVPESTPGEDVAEPAPEDWRSPDEPSSPPPHHPDNPSPWAPGAPGRAPRVVVPPAATTAQPSRSSLSKDSSPQVALAAAGAGSEAQGRRRTTPSSPTAATEERAEPPLSEDASPQVGPAAAADPSPMGMAPAAFGGGGAGAGAGSTAPVGPGQSGTPQAAASEAMAAQAAARSGPAGRRRSADRTQSADDGAMAGIPVSPARSARDEIADAAGPRHWTDPLRLARRIAAALNAPDSAGAGDIGFFWVTAVTAQGEIVVANSYGLAYLPDGTQLPEQVHMASADQAIPAAERARWATHPVMAVQGWAAHHRTTLRAVIATAEQLANSDPGVTTIVLEPDDIPASGTMTGRSPLQVVDPGAAYRLAATTDPRLLALLPRPPVDVDVPADQRPMLWLELMEPLMMGSTKGHEAAHLRAFHAYARAAQEAVLAEAHAAVDPVAQRAAVADWLYWKHLTGLLDEALANAH